MYNFRQTFDELLELAKKGDNSTVDISMADQGGSAKAEEGNAYSEGLIANSKVLYAFGKTVGTSLGTMCATLLHVNGSY